MADDIGHMWWRVQRHSGRSKDRWHTLAKGDEAQCRLVYDAEARELRQGTVELLNADGEIVHRCSAARLRTRW